MIHEESSKESIIRAEFALENRLSMNQNEDKLTQITRNCRDREAGETRRRNLLGVVERLKKGNLIWGFRVYYNRFNLFGPVCSIPIWQSVLST